MLFFWFQHKTNLLAYVYTTAHDAIQLGECLFVNNGKKHVVLNADAYACDAILSKAESFTLCLTQAPLVIGR